MRYGVGHLTKGEHPTTDGHGNQSSLARRWDKMLMRCYGRHDTGRTAAYQGCEVSEEFLDFQKFASWAVRQKGFDNPRFHLDKDLLGQGAKVYSRETCCFVPLEVNQLIKTRSRKTELPTGVKRMRDCNAFWVGFSINGRDTYIGTGSTPEAAFQLYKQHKERVIKETAERFKDVLDPRAFEVLMSYEIKITD